MGKAKGAKIEVTDYRLSLHYGICHGPVDNLLGILVGEKEAWTGDVDTEYAVPINQPELFGGNKKEGGPVGTAYFLPGLPTQVMPEALANKLGRSSANCPAYRGIASVFFYGSNYGSYYGYSGGGFLWGSNNPYLRSIWMKVRRSPKALPVELRMIGPDANPAAIIYECLTDRVWGMGASDAIIDVPSFETTAAVLLSEGFGMSMVWTRQSTIEAFVTEIIDHIQATLFVNPRTGKLTLKLIRADYDVDDLPVLDETNCNVRSFDRKAWGETTNEIVVTWTNPENEQDETVVAQDLANITIQGAVISDSRNYYGVRNADLAMFLAKRDLVTASAPLAAYEIDVDRSAWDFVPGGCAVLNYPEYGIEGLVLRLGKIDYGRPGSPTIKVSALEDVFGLPTSSYTTPDESQWEDPSADPQPITQARVITAPGFFSSAVLSVGDVAALEYPEVLSAVIASQDNQDATAYDLVQQTILPNGDVVGEVTGTKPILGNCVTIDVLPAEATTLLGSFPPIVGGTGPSISGFLFIGGTTEPFQEIALIQSFDPDTGWTIKRGVLDTVPRAWPTGTRMWFVSRGTNFVDTTQIRSAAEVVRYKLLTRTSRGLLPQSLAPVVGTTLSARPHLPSRPANVSVNGVGFSTLDVSGLSLTNVTVAWANRNRLLEDSQVLGWDDGNVTPEAGQTTTITVRSVGGTVLATYNGLTGTSYAIPLTDWGTQAVADVVVTSKRDGLESLQGASIRVKVRPFGMGDDWGDDWGGGDTGYIPPIEPPPTGGGVDPDPGFTFPDIPVIQARYTEV